MVETDICRSWPATLSAASFVLLTWLLVVMTIARLALLGWQPLGVRRLWTRQAASPLRLARWTRFDLLAVIARAALACWPATAKIVFLRVEEASLLAMPRRTPAPLALTPRSLGLSLPPPLILVLRLRRTAAQQPGDDRRRIAHPLRHNLMSLLQLVLL